MSLINLWILQILINLTLITIVQANYTIYLQVSSKPSSGSTAMNYIILKGNLGISPLTNINNFPNGTANPAILKDGQLVVINDKFPNDYGYINTVTVGNLGATLTMQSLNIFDNVRNLWSNMTFIYPIGYIQISSSTDFLYLVNGSWSDWSNWGSCSVTCGNGTTIRQRTCTNPAPANGGMSCNDSSTQWQTCVNLACPIISWGEWSSWAACSVTCNNGTQSRSRVCIDSSNSGLPCPGTDKDTQACGNSTLCPINGNWSSWNTWSSCSVSCGSNGIMQRSRLCNNPAPSNAGQDCSGLSTDTQSCTNVPLNCPVNGMWSSWSTWSSCSSSCGFGTRSRTRNCDNPSPLNGGLGCSSCVTVIFGSCGMSDINVENCTWISCSDPQLVAQNIISDTLSKLNISGTNSTMSVQQTMNLAFDVVNKIQSALQNALLNSTGPLMIQTNEVTVGLQSLSPTSGQQNISMVSTDKGKISIGSSLNLTTPTVVTFSALKSSVFFSASSVADTSAAMLSLTIQNVSNTTPVQLSVSIPNSNQQVESDMLSPVKFNVSNQLIQTLQYTSLSTVYKLSMNLSNATDFTIFFSASSLANTTDSSDAFIYLSNQVLNVTLKNVQLSASWDTSSGMLRITIPSGQVTPPNNMTLVMITSTNTTNGILLLSLGVASLTPRIWNFDMEVWQDFSASVDDTSDISNINFKSNFLGTFSAKIFIAPNMIDFKNVFANFASLLANSYVVLIVIILIFILYLLLVIVMWRKDRRESILLRYEPLLDNDPEYEYSYVISVHTGSCRNAGTSSDIFINLLGKWGSSGHRKMTDGYRDGLFETGTVCNFVMTTDSPLGDLMALRIWHNSSGIKPSWNLEKLVIEDIQTNKMYIFMCETWLSDSKFDGNTERVLLEIKRDEKFQNLFQRMKVSGVMDKHIIAGITNNTGVSCYTRVQKVTVFVTMFFLIMVSNAMFFGKDNNLSGDANFKIDFGLISITWFQFYTGMISVLITYPCIFIASEIFRRTRRWKRRWTEDQEAKMKKMFLLPKGFIFVGWSLLFVALVASVFFTFLYSLQWGGEKSNQWLQTFFVGIFGMVFLSDPIILLIIFVLAKKLLGAVSTDQEANIDEFVKDDLKKVLGANLNPPDQEKLEKIKKDKASGQRLSRVVGDALTYVLSLLLLTALAYDARSQVTFDQTKMIRSRFIKSNVQTYMDFYDWAQGILNESYPKVWYNNMNRTGDLTTAIAICDCLRQGPFRIRQIRVKRNTCTVSALVSKVYGNVPCNENYNLLSEDTRSFSVKWTPLANSSVSFNDSNWNRNYLSPTQTVINAFLYQNNTISGGYPFEGTFGIYGGGGYIASLGMKQEQAAYIIRNLQANNWLDKLTRAIFFEGTVYNGNTNLFTTIQVLFEQPNSGGLRMFPYGVRSYRLYDYLPGNMIVLLLMQILYALTVVLNIYREIKKVCKQKKEYFSSNWNLVELLSIFLSLSIIICTAVRIMVTINAITMLNVNKGFYVSFDKATSWLETSCILMGISSFVSIIRVLKYMGFNKYISIMQGTIVRAYTQLSSLGFMFICFLIAFLTVGNILFSLNNVKFTNLLTSTVSLFGVFVAIVKYGDMFETPPAFDSALYYNVWSALSVFFITSVFICILNDTYAETIDENLFDYDKEMVDHVWNIFNEMMTGFKSSMKYTVPDALKKKAIVPVDMSDVDMQFASKENIRNMVSKRVNPSLRRKLADLNGEKYKTEKRENKPNSENDVYINPISFTDIKVAATGSQILDDKTFAERLPKYRAKQNAVDTNNQPPSYMEPVRPLKPNPKIDYILQNRKKNRHRRNSRNKP
uniref:PKD1L-2 n=1 Tax=Schmidtea mediterranea TaxID=79327 RepID=A0A0H3YFF8_SCHMD|nr:PKD1L-2 [Schmidtea mediterranea]